MDELWSEIEKSGLKVKKQDVQSYLTGIIDLPYTSIKQ